MKLIFLYLNHIGLWDYHTKSHQSSLLFSFLSLNIYISYSVFALHNLFLFYFILFFDENGKQATNVYRIY